VLLFCVVEIFFIPIWIILIFSPQRSEHTPSTQMNTNKQHDDEPHNLPEENRTDEVAEEVTKEIAEMKQEEENDVDNKKTTKTAIQDKKKDKDRKEQGDEFAIEQLERLSTRKNQSICTSPNALVWYTNPSDTQVS